MPFFDNRLSVEASLNLSVLRGDKKASYSSITSAYFYNGGDGLIYLGPDELLDPDITGNEEILQLVLQGAYPVYVSDPGSSGSSFVYEASLGFRARVWKGIEAIGGFRSARYEDILDEIRPAPLSLGSAGVPGIVRTQRSLAYEGFYFGASFTY
jgi:hypothetical protein